MNNNQPAILFDPRTLTLVFKNKSVSLTSNMASCLELLLANEGQVVSKQQIFEACWGCKGVVVSEASIRQVVTHLRKKIQALDAGNRCIVTSPRRGYILKSNIVRMIVYPPATLTPCPSALPLPPQSRWRKRLTSSYPALAALAMVLTLLAHVAVLKFSRAAPRGTDSELLVEYVTGSPLPSLLETDRSAIVALRNEAVTVHHYYSYLSYLEGKIVHTLACADDISLHADSCRSLLLFR
ncbi:winged helix-turn-helix domain-containing protein [Pantoea eucrina]|uniref:winged helix-turn-helix domain-containing protein n=1 Tax=Pantoea eucrina TaxID=472693 RepID=UPI003CECAE1F